jgi:hypothetical protein
MVAAKVANMRHGGDRKSEEIKMPIGVLKSQPPISIKEAAEMLNVSERIGGGGAMGESPGYQTTRPEVSS